MDFKIKQEMQVVIMTTAFPFTITTDQYSQICRSVNVTNLHTEMRYRGCQSGTQTIILYDNTIII